jgi:aminotransferase
MTPRIARAVDELPPSGLRTFFDLVAQVEGVVTLGVGEPDFPTPWHACDQVVAAMERGDTSYTPSTGIMPLREAICAHTQRLYGVEYDPGTEAIVTHGVSEALDLIFRAILNPGDKAIVAEPCYVSYPACVLMAGGQVTRLLTVEADNFALDPDRVRAAIEPGTKAILISYPNNPTGAVMTREQLLPIAEIAVEKDLLVISDEVYDRLIYGGHEHTCLAALPGMRERTILMNGFSKTYAMTGLRLGYALGPPDLIAAMTKIHQYTALCCSVLAQYAAIEALRNGEEEAMRMRAEYGRRRPYLHRALNDIGLTCFEPKGAFYCFPSIQGTGLTSREFATRLLAEEKVAVIPGTAFGDCGEGFIRCTYATSLDNIKIAVSRIGDFLGRLERA